MLTLLQQLRDQAVIENIDYYFAKLIAQQGQHLSKQTNDLACFLAAQLSFLHQKGHSCLWLDERLLTNPFELQAVPEFSAVIQELHHLLPETVAQWPTLLRQHPAFSLFSITAENVAPIILRQFNSHFALYLHRIGQDEYYIAQRLSQIKTFSYTPALLQEIKTILATLFAENQSTPDWQKIAVATAFSRSITFISGGPGTGKTTTVAKLLLGLQWLQQLQGLPPLSIRLAAPTGKAATRLTESLHQAVKQIALPVTLTTNLPQEAATIHRLLGMRPNTQPTYHQQRPLNIDVLVIDEASMINLSLMATLLRGVHPETRLIFLGDKDQLASVEAGSIMVELGQFLQFDYSPQQSDYLAQVCTEQLPQAVQNNFIRDSLCHLQHSYRFKADTGIGQLARLVNQRQAEQSWQLFSHYPDIQALPLTTDCPPNMANTANQEIIRFAVNLYQDYFNFVRQQTTWHLAEIETAFTLFKRCRLLSALRTGLFGVEQLNQQIADALRQQKQIDFRLSHEWYLGKPVIVLQNDHNIRLFNGDIGLVLPDSSGNLKVWFETEQGFRDVLSSRVPSVEPAYVMTVHKSQGSEFEHTVLVLPQEYNSLLSKELIYTAITRAKRYFSVFCNENIWLMAVRNQTIRHSGLAEQIKQYFNQEE
ncbi:exodeoxyribonuclease V subunit alpha [Gallibacterium sp. AGMB14963]|uniref:exodeoxyribonuclease V subunit alpha n=1 Tax=Gallibacterium faecale TaxID=3019086 RepID=UPI0022F1811A|nr:exodeoxyribonuclease V subunit alpha [Gallibacterium sp. AGMB14963]MDA3977466.1 exodeoxyribonuclease V subunit alpha [Gallibacterium sp. AGMB14963]